MTIGDKTFEPIAHRINGNLVLEFEAQTDEARDYSGGTYSQLRGRLNGVNQTASVGDFCARATDAVHMATDFLAHLLSLQVGSKVESEQSEYSIRLKDTRHTLTKNAGDVGKFGDGLADVAINLLTTLEAHGAALVCNDEIQTLEHTLAKEKIAELAAWLWENHDEEVFASARLASQLAPFANEESARGVLVARLTRRKPEYLLWFRGEYAHQINWAGDQTGRGRRVRRAFDAAQIVRGVAGIGRGTGQTVA